jgi:hypothetical protein
MGLEFGLGKAYSLINKKAESKLFYGRALRRLDKIINVNKYIPSLLRSRNTLYKEEDYYKIQNIKIFSKSMFEQIIILNEKIELFDLRIRILSAVEDLEKSDRMEAKKKVYVKIIELHLDLIKIFDKELENEKIEKNIKEKYSAFIVYLIYQVFKLFIKTKTSLKK